MESLRPSWQVMKSLHTSQQIMTIIELPLKTLSNKFPASTSVDEEKYRRLTTDFQYGTDS